MDFIVTFMGDTLYVLTKLLFNFFLPPLSSYQDESDSIGKFEHPIYANAGSGSLWGFGAGLLLSIGLICISSFGGGIPFFGALITANLFTYGLPLLIGLPWLFSIIGRGIGCYSGIREICNGLRIDNPDWG